MARQAKHLNINDSPELLRLVDAMKNDQRPVVLKRDNQEVAIISPIALRPRRRVRGRPTTENDPLWKLVGIGESAEPTDIAREKDRYVAEAYAHLHQSE